MFSTEIVDHGGRCGDAMQALALDQWWHPVASIEAQDVLHRHRAMRIAPYRPAGMAIEIGFDLLAFSVSSISLLATTIS